MGRVSPRRATDFLLLRQKESRQRKGDPAVGVPALRSGQPAVLAFRGVRAKLACGSNTRSPDPRKAPLLGTHRRECSGRRFARPTEYQQPNQKHKDAPRRVLPWYSCWGPLCACRGASTAGCPKRSAGTRTVGSPFFCLLFFGETKKSESPAGARPGPHPQKKHSFTPGLFSLRRRSRHR